MAQIKGESSYLKKSRLKVCFPISNDLIGKIPSRYTQQLEFQSIPDVIKLTAQDFHHRRLGVRVGVDMYFLNNV